MAKQCFLKRGNKVVGPMGTDDLKQRVANGKIIASDELCATRTGPWKRIDSVPSLRELIGPSENTADESLEFGDLLSEAVSMSRESEAIEPPTSETNAAGEVPQPRQIRRLPSGDWGGVMRGFETIHLGGIFHFYVSLIMFLQAMIICAASVVVGFYLFLVIPFMTSFGFIGFVIISLVFASILISLLVLLFRSGFLFEVLYSGGNGLFAKILAKVGWLRLIFMILMLTGVLFILPTQSVSAFLVVQALFATTVLVAFVWEGVGEARIAFTAPDSRVRLLSGMAVVGTTIGLASLVAAVLMIVGVVLNNLIKVYPQQVVLPQSISDMCNSVATSDVFTVILSVAVAGCALGPIGKSMFQAKLFSYVCDHCGEPERVKECWSHGYMAIGYNVVCALVIFFIACLWFDAQKNLSTGVGDQLLLPIAVFAILTPITAGLALAKAESFEDLCALVSDTLSLRVRR
jgi:hypothetical protein